MVEIILEIVDRMSYKKMGLSKEKRSEHIAKKQEKQSIKLKSLEKKSRYLHSIGFKNRANDIQIQCEQIKGEITNRSMK